jgi:hypothetical protein
MKIRKLFRRNATRCLSVFAAVVLAPLAISAQPQKQPAADQFIGTFKGTAKMTSGEMDVTLEITFTDGKFSGRALSANNEYKISSGKFEGGKLTIKFGPEADAASLTLRQSGDTFSGDWIRGEQKGTVEVKRVVADASVDLISGEWEAVADAQGQPFPFTLVLKLEGDKLTGSSSSQLGNVQISTGAWKDGKLSILLDGGGGGQIALVATMIDGKLAGDYDYAGQASGKWVAIKKK